MHSPWLSIIFSILCSAIVHDTRLMVYLVEWAIASHGMYESALIFVNAILKQKNLYIVSCVQCYIQNQNTTMKNK
jgi:hypothetical protein